MKTFNEWLKDNHPEHLDEGVLDSLGKSKFVRNAVTAAGLGAAALGGYGMRPTRAATPDASANRPAASQKVDDDPTVYDTSSEEGIYDTSSEEGIAAIKAKMLRMAQKVPMKTSTHNIGGKEVRVSRGSAHMSGGNVIPPSKFDPKTGGQNKSRQPTKILPQLPAGPTSSPDFGGAVE
jgi:hypothetical protein